MDKLRDFVLPSGNLFESEALDPGELGPGPIAPGPGEIPLSAKWNPDREAEDAAADMAALNEALEPQRERAKAAEKREKDVTEKRAKDAPFRVWLAELGEMLGSMAGEELEGRNEVEFTLFHAAQSEESKKFVMLTKFTRTPEEAVSEGFPDLEKVTLETAREKGIHGLFQWNIRAWLKGELIKNTTHRINIAPQPGSAPERKDPMQELTHTLGMMKMIREAVGGPAPAGDGTAAQSAALLARLEAMEKYRAELRELEDRHERKLKAEIADAYERGKVDGEKDARMKLERKIWELERDLERAEIESPKADMVDKVVSMIGGPGAVQGILAKILASSSRPTPRPGPGAVPARPQALQIQPRQPNARERPAAPPVQAPPVPEPLWEPPPEAVSRALEALAEGKRRLEASPEGQKPEYQAIIRAFGDCLTDGHAATGARVAEWWKGINTPIFPHQNGQKISMYELAAWLCEDPEPTDEDGDEEMTLDELKDLLRERLQEGKAPSEILDECRELVSPETLDEWKGYLKWMPTAGAVAFLGIPEDLSEQGAAVVEAFKA